MYVALQGFFGVKKEEAYKHTDKFHPAVGIRVGFEWDAEESLINWWKRHDKDASFFSSHLTDQLVRAIMLTQNDDTESLKNLFAQADKWLIVKDGTFTLRFYQVEALRNNVYYHLISNLNISENELAFLNYQNLLETNYFIKHWARVSHAVSWLKSDATRALDMAFMTHANAVRTNQHDANLNLLHALDTWINEKENLKSARYDSVVKIREHLQYIVDMLKQPHHVHYIGLD